MPPLLHCVVMILPPPPPVPAAIASPVADTLAPYLWSRRVLLLFADSMADPKLQAQQADLTAHAADLTERDMVVIMSADPALRQQVRAPDGFAVVLVGKDGGVKLRRTSPVPFKELAATVDAMPMRQDEMRKAR